MLDFTETKGIFHINKLTALDSENNIDCCITFDAPCTVVRSREQSLTE